MVPNRKKNLSSKIIVDEYDHLILNQKIYPNYQSFMEGPINSQYSHAHSKYPQSKDQSQQSEYSIHKPSQNLTDIQCRQCGQLFSARIFESHVRICQKKYFGQQNEKIPSNFNKKNQYNFFQLNQDRKKTEEKLISGRKKPTKKSYNNIFEESCKQQELKKQLSKKSIHSQQKKTVKRPSSSTRNKVDLKQHENLKQKILNKLQATRKRNPEQKQEITKRISQSSRRNITSSSNPKSINKNGIKIQTNKYSTVKSSSINKKLANNKNSDFNRSQIMNNYANTQKRKQKPQFLSKVSLKQDKKQTLKKKNMNVNSSFLNNQQRQKQKNKNYMQDKFFTENNSFAGKSTDVFAKMNNHKDKQLIREELRKQGMFRRQSSSSASKRKFNRQKQEQKPAKHQLRGSQQVNDQYYFFQNHPSSVPSYVMKRPDENFARHDNFDNNNYGSSSSNIIRNKLGINKNFIHPKESNNQNNKKNQIPPKFIRQANQQSENMFFHQRINSNRQRIINQTKNQNQLHMKTNSRVQQGPQRQPNKQQVHLQNSQNIERRRPQNRYNIQNPVRQSNGQRPQTRYRPENPMGQQRQINQRRQNMNMAQNRPSPRITNQRMNSNNEQQRPPSQTENRQQRRQNNQPRRQNNQPRRQNNQPRRQNNQPRRQENSQIQTQTRNIRRQQNASRRQETQPRRQNQTRNNRRNNANRNQQSRNGGPRRMRNQTLNFISNTLNEQFEVMNQHFNLLNNIFSNFSSFVNVNITTDNTQNPTTFVFRNNRRRRNNRQNEYGEDSSGQSYSECSDFSSDFSQDDTFENQTDYDEEQYLYEDQENRNPGMTEHEINSIPILRYNKQKHGSNQCTICLVQLNQKQPFKKLYCDHVFHQQCIDEWLKRKNACPVCRDQMGASS